MIDQHASLGEKFIKKGFWLYVFSFIVAPIGYIVKIIISGELSVSEVGILYGIISLITLFSAFNDFGMTESINYFVPKFITEKRYDKVKSILFFAFLAQMSTWIIIALFFFFWAEYISNGYFQSTYASSVLKIFAFYFLGINIFQVLSTFFISVQNTFAHKLSELVRMLFILGSVFFIYFWGSWSLVNYSYSWLIWLYIWMLFTIILFYFSYFKKHLINEKILWDKKLWIEIIKYASMVFLWAQAATILGQIDMQMIIYILGTTDAWYYTNYLSIIGIPFLIIGPIFTLLFPVFSELYSKWEIEKIKTIKEKCVNIFMALWIMFNVFFFIFSEQIAYILFWEKFIASWVILKYSILFLIFNFLLQINFYLMAGIWKVIDRVKIISVAIVFNTILNIVFIYWIWVSGAALATAFGWVLIFVLSEYYLGKNYRVIFRYKDILKNFAILGIIWTLFHVFFISIFEWLERWMSFLFLLILSIIWCVIFTVLNYKMFRGFILQLKKIKWESKT